jgi:hypothetical protein
MPALNLYKDVRQKKIARNKDANWFRAKYSESFTTLNSLHSRTRVHPAFYLFPFSRSPA